MPFINVRVIEGVFDAERKREIIERLTDAMVEIEGLAILATNLWWSWSTDARQVFRRIDEPLWHLTKHNPLELLRRVDPARLAAEWGGYFRLGQMFVKLIEHPQVMHLCVRYGLPRPVLMRFTIKLLAHLYDTKDGDWMDRVIHSLSRAVPAA